MAPNPRNAMADLTDSIEVVSLADIYDASAESSMLDNAEIYPGIQSQIGMQGIQSAIQTGVQGRQLQSRSALHSGIQSGIHSELQSGLQSIVTYSLDDGENRVLKVKPEEPFMKSILEERGYGDSIFNDQSKIPHISEKDAYRWVSVRRLDASHVSEQMQVCLMLVAFYAGYCFILWCMTAGLDIIYPAGKNQQDDDERPAVAALGKAKKKKKRGGDRRPFAFIRSDAFHDRIESFREVCEKKVAYLTFAIVFHAFQYAKFIVDVYNTSTSYPAIGEPLNLVEAILGLLLVADPLTEVLWIFMTNPMRSVRRTVRIYYFLVIVALLSPLYNFIFHDQAEHDRKAGNTVVGSHWFSVGFLGLIRIRVLYDVIFPVVSDEQSHAMRAFHRVARKIIEFLTFCAIVVVILWSVEYCDGCVARKAPNLHSWKLDDALWFGYTTLLTIGYGDFAPQTTLGKLMTMVMIIGLMLTAMNSIDAGIRILKDQEKGYAHYPRARRPFVIVTGSPSSSTAANMLREFFHPDQADVHRDDMDICFLISPAQFGQVRQAINAFKFRKPQFATSIHFFRGSVTNNHDFTRVACPYAKAVIIVPNFDNQMEKQREDIESIIRAVAVRKSSPPNLRIIVLMLQMQNRFMLQGLIPKRDIICVDDLKYRMIARSAYIPGLICLLGSLLKCSSTKDEEAVMYKKLAKQQEAYEASGRVINVKNYFTLFRKSELHYAQGKEFYVVELNSSYMNFPFIEIVRDVLYRSRNKDTLLLGYMRYDPLLVGSMGKQQMEMCLFPEERKEPFAHQRFTAVLGIFIASDEEDIRQRTNDFQPMLPLEEDDSEEEKDFTKDSENGDEDLEELARIEEAEAAAARRLARIIEFAEKRGPTSIPSEFDLIDEVEEKKERKKQQEPKLFYKKKLLERQLFYLKENRMGIDTIYEVGRKAIENRYMKTRITKAGHALPPSGDNCLPLNFGGNHFLVCITGKGGMAMGLDFLIENLIMGLEEEEAESVADSEEDDKLPSAANLKNSFAIGRRGSIASSASGFTDGGGGGGESIEDDEKEWKQKKKPKKVTPIKKNAGHGFEKFNMTATQRYKEAAAAAFAEEPLPSQADKPVAKKPESDGDSDASTVDEERKPLTEIVLVVLSQTKPTDWDTLYKFQNQKIICVWMQGNPTKLLDLERCSFRLARYIFVTGTTEHPIDAQSVFTTRLIESQVGTETIDNLAPRVCTELHHEANFRYIPLGIGTKIDHQSAKENTVTQSWSKSIEARTFTKKSLMKQSYFRSGRYAAGQLFTSSVLTSLAVNQVFRPPLLNLIKNLSDALQLMDIPTEFVGETYEKLWAFMLEQNLLCIALYRRCETMAKTLGASTSLGIVTHAYPLVCPPARDTQIRKGDKIYVLMNGFTYIVDG